MPLAVAMGTTNVKYPFLTQHLAGMRLVGRAATEHESQWNAHATLVTSLDRGRLHK